MIDEMEQVMLQRDATTALDANAGKQDARRSGHADLMIALR
jgi:hypothetical protein